MNVRTILAAGIELPPAIAKLVAEAEAAEAAQASTKAARAELGKQPPDIGTAIRNGTDPIAAAQAARDWQTRAELVAAAEQAVSRVHESVNLSTLPAAISAASEPLLGTIRERVEQLVTEVHGAFRVLGKFEYDGARIAAGASSSEMKAYQATRPLQAEYAALRRAWGEVWTEGTMGTPGARLRLGYLRRRDGLRAHADLLRLASLPPDARTAALATPAELYNAEQAAEASRQAAQRAEVELRANRRRREGVGA